MNYVIFTYSIILLLSTYFGHKKKLGVSTVSVVLVFILCFSALFGLSYSNIFLKLLMLTSLKRDIYIGKKLGEYNYKTYIILELHR